MVIRPFFLPAVLSLHDVVSLERNFEAQGELPEKFTTIALGVGPLSKWRTDFIFGYEVFPRSILTFEAQWQCEEREMRIGDVIVQRASLPPGKLGLRLEFAVRVSERFEESDRLGFAYETLKGHPEKGISEFYFEEVGGKVHFTIHTYSSPGHWMSRLVARPFSFPYQAWCTRRAMAHVKSRFDEINLHTT